jgi:tetratricopeptide (TPR) repeat protein
MKKFLSCFIFIILFTYLSNTAYAMTKVKNHSLAGDYYAVGVDAFSKGCYDKAEANFEHAIKINPKNVNARYYLAQVYLKQKMISDAIKQYNKIIIIAPASYAAVLSQKGLFLIKQSERGIKTTDTSNNDLSSYNDNYFDYVLSPDGSIMRWASFPITVYIEPKRQKVFAQNAFKQWQGKSNNLVSFTFVNLPDKAQITVYFKNKLETSSGENSFIAGYSKPYSNGKNLVKSEIYILTVDPQTGQSLEDDVITASTLHEIGHSLGFKGHSPDSNDVMSPNSTEPKLNLTKRDINTLNIFYKTDSKTLLARNKGQTDVQLQQALDYVKNSPDKSVGWANLGDIYRSKKMYRQAITNYSKAISIEPDKAELYNLLGSTYEETGDKQNAYVNLKKACDIDSSNAFYLYQFSKLCIATGKKETAQSYVNNYLKANPQSMSDEKIQSLMKMLK